VRAFGAASNSTVQSTILLDDDDDDDDDELPIVISMAPGQAWEVPTEFHLEGENEAPTNGDDMSIVEATEEGERDHLRVWDTEEATTPMTTRPHFALHNTLHSPAASPHSHASPSSALSEWNELLAIPNLTSSLILSRRYSEGTDKLTKGCPTESTCSLEGEHSPLLTSIPVAALEEERVSEQHQSSSSCVVAAVYGTINAIVVLPILMSFGAIIYRDDAFAPYLSVLVKLTLVSGIVHQLCFSAFSSLPFAVGQVQDAGLIFLSSMASTIVQYCRDRGHNDETMLATVTVALSIATALLGVGLVLLGYLQLAQYVKHLPTRYVRDVKTWNATETRFLTLQLP
jgi:hypothetical protein